MAKDVKKTEQYLLLEDGSEKWLDASDCSPNCNRRTAQERANEYRRPVIVREVRGDYNRPELYRVLPKD